MRAGNTAEVRKAKADARLLRCCLSWVHLHAYDALETELSNQLAVAVRSATDALDRLEQAQPVRLVPKQGRGPTPMTRAASGLGGTDPGAA